MIRTPEMLVKALEFLSTNTSPAACARHIGAKSSKIIFAWGYASQSEQNKGIPAADSPFGVRWPDPEAAPIYFHEAIQQARKIFLALATMEATSLIGPDAGHRRVVIEGGKIQWSPSPEVAADTLSLDEMDWIAKYGTRNRNDIWARDEDGHLIPLTVIDPLPAQLRIHLMRSLVPALNPPERRETAVSHSGFLIIGKNKKKPEQQPKSELRQDLEERLSALRQKRLEDRRVTPEGKVDIQGRGSNGMDPPERTSTPHSDDVRPATEPRPTLKQEVPPKPDYSRPKQHSRLDGEDQVRRPPGGFSAATGKMT